MLALHSINPFTDKISTSIRRDSYFSPQRYLCEDICKQSKTWKTKHYDRLSDWQLYLFIYFIFLVSGEYCIYSHSSWCCMLVEFCLMVMKSLLYRIKFWSHFHLTKVSCVDRQLFQARKLSFKNSTYKNFATLNCVVVRKLSLYFFFFFRILTFIDDCIHWRLGHVSRCFLVNVNRRGRSASVDWNPGDQEKIQKKPIKIKVVFKEYLLKLKFQNTN